MRLLSAGMRITYAGLLKAAGDMVAGVEVWVQAQQQLGIQSDIPALAVAVCCGGDWADIELPAEDGGALLQLALNCSNPDTATAAARRMPALLEPGVARSLLLTAATRQHSKAVKHMVGLAVVQQHMHAELLETVLSELLESCQNCRGMLCLYALCELPAAATLSSDAAMKLLRSAVEVSSWEVAYELCHLAAAQQLSSEQVDTLLQACMQNSTLADRDYPLTIFQRGSIFEAIMLELPGAQQLSNNAVLDNLHKAITSGCAFEFVYRLQNLPAAAGISSAEATSLLQEAFSVIPSGDTADWAIRDLVEFWQAVSEPNSAEVAELLHAVQSTAVPPQLTIL
ncbi:hypothetical protein COO60DRAFT_1560445 [Scenedesmus sp. NREL 46B-D3]|nr:hypothetical protein COO60DRAFT_1560445 [Scenedesmus sp. NREL 46B-D3]